MSLSLSMICGNGGLGVGGEWRDKVEMALPWMENEGGLRQDYKSLLANEGAALLHPWTQYDISNKGIK